MASKYSVELSLDTKGYKEGAKQAEDANADFASSIGEVSKSLPNLRKALAAARKETTGLAFAYSKLSEQEKNSGFGKAMAKQLNEAKKRTAELIDMNGDLANELKNLASDTATWDAMKEGIGIVKDSMTAAITTFGEMTNTADDLAPVLKKVAQVQSIAATAISVGNALQKQSAVMCGIRKIQEVALTKAIEAETVAQGKATVAQKLFNMVAKANPYVLLASAILAAGAALGTYMLFANKAKDSTVKLNKEMHDASIQGRKDAQDDITKLDILYKATQNVNIGMDARKKAVKELQDQYPAYFGNMTTEQILLGQASEKYQQLKNDIIAVAMAKAYEQKIADIAKENVELEDQIEKQKEIAKNAEKTAEAAKNAQNAQTYGTAQINMSALNYDKMRGKAEEANKTLADQQKQLEDNKAAQEKYLDKINETIPAQQRLNENKGGGKTNTPKSGGATNVKAETGSIVALEKEISSLQDKLRNGLIPDDSVQETVNRINDLQGQVKELKIKYGFEKPEKAKTKLEQLQKDLDDAQKAYIIAVDTNDEQARQAAQEAYYKAQAELDKYKASIKIEVQVTDADKAKIQKEVNDIVSEAMNGKQQAPSFDFSALKENLPEELASSVDRTLEEYNRVYQARQQLMDKMNAEGASDAAISAAQEGLDALHEKWTQLSEDVETYNEANEAIKNANKNAETLANTVEGVGNAVNAAAGLFSALGEASEDNSMKAMGIVAQAVATIALSFAKALTTAKTWVDWLAFGITGMTTMVTMISQIKKLNAGAYAGGGIVGGSSYYGDHMTASVNSGEMIFNRRQQKNLFDAIDNNRIGNIGRQSEVSISSVAVEGSDLILTINNTLKENGKKTIG